MQVVVADGHRSWAFKPGTPYSVFAIEGVGLRLVDEEGGMGLWPRRGFQIVDPHVAPGWRLHRIEGRSRIHLGPVEAGVRGFFEDVFDRVPGSDVPVRTSESLSSAEKARFVAWFQRAPWAHAKSAVSHGIFPDIATAVKALARLVGEVSDVGLPPGSAADPRRPGAVAVPIERGAMAILRVSGGHVKVEGSFARNTWEDGEKRHWTALPPPLLPGDIARPEPGPLTVRLKVTSSVPNLTPARPYTVLEIFGTRLRLISDNGDPALFPWIDLEPISRTLTPEWQVVFTKNGTAGVAPEAFAAPGYFASLRSRSPRSDVPLLEMPGLREDERGRFSRWFGGHPQS